MFDDPAQGTGMIILLKRRKDRRFDIYRQPGLTLDPELAQVGGELGAWVEADIDPARFDISHDGVIADAAQAVNSPQLLSDDPRLARRLLGDLPSPLWGRDELGTGEMWNSNSVIAWLLAISGLPMDGIDPPAGGRAPGWEAGLVAASRRKAALRARAG